MNDQGNQTRSSGTIIILIIIRWLRCNNKMMMMMTTTTMMMMMTMTMLILVSSWLLEPGGLVKILSSGTAHFGPVFLFSFQASGVFYALEMLNRTYLHFATWMTWNQPKMQGTSGGYRYTSHWVKKPKYSLTGWIKIWSGFSYGFNLCWVYVSYTPNSHDTHWPHPGGMPVTLIPSPLFGWFGSLAGW